MQTILAIALVAANVTCAALAAPIVPTPQQQIDALLSPLQQPDWPGLAIAVVRDGAIVYKKGIGLADLAQDVRITPATPMHAASLSKQFTAFAIHLLAQDGKLSLDDDVHKTMPELPDFGVPITLRQLMHHTSGLRDQWELLQLAGWRLDDVITEDDILGLIKRQRALNFPPGQAQLYSNTGYTLLAIVVKRVSGQSLRDFAQARIFDPLGMRHTQFVADYQAIVKGRAASYGPNSKGGYDYIALSYSNAGATSLSTTVEDLALWDRNFYDAKVGGQQVIAAMQADGVLSNGKPAGYASGLILRKYRGLNTVWHNGGDAGFRSDLLRFPDQRFSVIVLANAGDIDPTALAQKVADAYLFAALTPAGVAPPAVKEVSVDTATLDRFVGTWQLSPDFSLTVARDGAGLTVLPTGQQVHPVFVSGDRSLFLKVVDGRFAFDAPGQDGVIQGGTYTQNGRAQRMTRVAPPAPLPDAALAAYEGEYYSDELHVLYTVARQGGKLTLTHPRGAATLAHGTGHTFHAGYPFGRIDFACTAGNCNTFTVNGGRVRNLLFTRVSIVPASAGPSR